jgi:hypothetical protein
MSVKRNIVLQYYQIFCNLSLDVVIGVGLNVFALAHVFHLQAPMAWYIVLMAGTWLVYLLDHVIDINRTDKNYPGPVHQFIKKNQPYVWTLMILLVLFIVFFTFYQIHIKLIICGSIMVFLTAVHLLLARLNLHAKGFFNNKEFGVAFIYATAIFIFPMYMLIQSVLIDALFYYYMLFLLLVYQNLLLCSIIEYPVDVSMNNSSLIRSIGKPRGKLVFIGVSLAGASFMVLMLLRLSWYHPLLLGLYFIILSGNCVIYLWDGQLQNHFDHRKLAELLFWLPGISLLF